MPPPDPAYAAAHRAQLRARKRRIKAPNAKAADITTPRRSPTQQAGDIAEAQALRHLERAGMTQVAQNFSCRSGEIDLIMEHEGVLVFVEVRSRALGAYGGAAASVGHDKQRRLGRTAEVFLKTRWRGSVPPCRFDVVAIEQATIHWLKDAFRP